MQLVVDIQKQFPGFQLKTAFEADGRTLGLLGGSGSGKSMTLKCIAGIITPDKGYIALNGTVLFDSRKGINVPPQKRHVGYLFQNYALFPNMTVEQNIRCGKRTVTKTEMRDILERFYLNGLGKRYPSQISGGQQQRVALARMLLSDPSVILLDEPFSALDAYLRGEMEREVKNLLDHFEGPSLLVSHNRDEIYRLCDRIAVYHNGQLDVIGEKKQVFAHPLTRTAAVLTGCRNVLEASPAGEHSLWINGWNIQLKTTLPVNRQSQAVGIRAHYFTCVDTDGENVIPCQVNSVVESPFETIAYLRPAGGTELLCWKAEQAVVQKAAQQNQMYLYIAPEQVLPLEGNKTKGD